MLFISARASARLQPQWLNHCAVQAPFPGPSFHEHVAAMALSITPSFAAPAVLLQRSSFTVSIPGTPLTNLTQSLRRTSASPRLRHPLHFRTPVENMPGRAPGASPAMSSASAPEIPSLLIVGAGVLGRCVAAQWQARYPGAVVVGETRSDGKHAELAALGITPALNGGGEVHNGGEKFSRVVFCAPPGGNDDYPGAVRAALARVREGGVFVFTSSGGVYQKGEVLSEDSPVLTEGERSLRLLDAENAVLERAEGRVVRLAGLYNLGRGAHGYWLRAKGQVSGVADSLVNLVHYEDAAAMVVACLEKGDVGRRLFLAADGVPISREDICVAAVGHPMFSECALPQFDGDGVAATKRYDNSLSRGALGWEPRYASFATFMKEEAARDARQ